MSILFDWSDLAAVASGSWILPPDTSRATGITDIGMDTRTLSPGELFLAYRGENHDSHDFLPQAVERGVAAIAVSREPSADIVALLSTAGIGVLRVKDSLAAYQAWGHACRRRYPDLKVVGITGSCGKTSTKEIVRAVVARQLGDAVLATEGNTNNLVGVPRNLLRLREQHRVAVLELGTNAPGEIATLTRLTEPTIGILTNVGPVHLEGLGSLEGVAREKAAIFAPLAGSDGTAILAHELLDRYECVREALPHARLTVGFGDAADVQVEYVRGDLAGSTFRLACPARGIDLTVETSLLGRHQALNAGFGLAVALTLGIPAESVAEALARIALPGMRMQVQRRDGVAWVNDAYNANPDSMRALVDWLATQPQEGRLFLCLGDMLELGPEADRLHSEVLTHARQLLPDACLLPVGSLMRSAAEALGLPGWPTVEVAREALHGQLAAGDFVVLKGSRGMRMEGLLG